MWRGLLVAVCACATAGPPPYRKEVDRTFARTAGKQVPAPDEAAAHRWKLGQWAVYRRERERAVETFTVVAEETCGVWILRQYYDAEHLERWWLCFRRHDDADVLDVGMGVSVRDFEPPEAYVLSGVPIVQALPWITAVAPSGSRGTDHEDVDVPAGHFESAIRTPTAWVHPAVPFGGIVKDRDRVLVDFGEHDAPSVIQQLALELAGARHRFARPRMFEAVGAGTMLAPSVMTQGSVRMTERLDITSELAVVGLASTGDSDLFALVGVQWNPFGRARWRRRSIALASGIYARAAAGFAMLERGDTTAGIGLGTGAAVGWLPLQGHDWALGVELDGHMSLLNANVGERHSASVVGLVQLYLP